MKKIIISISLIVIVSISALLYFGVYKKEAEPPAKLDRTRLGEDIKELGEDAMRAKMYGPLVSVYVGMVKKTPESVDVKRKLAFAYFSATQYDKAYPILKEVEKKIDGDAEIYFELGFIEHRNKNYEEAMKNLSKALEIDAKMERAKKLLGIMK